MKARLLFLITLTLTTDFLWSEIPPFCVRYSKVLICKKLNFKLRQLSTAVSYEVVVDFVFFNSRVRACTCKIIYLVKMLRLTDVTAVTMRPCTLGHLKRCKVDPVVTNPQLVAGLIVSRDDPRRNWAIKHHVDKLWSKFKKLPNADIRSFFLNSLIRDVQAELQRLQSPNSILSRAYADFVAGRLIVVPSEGGQRATTTEPFVRRLLQKWKSMAAALDTTALTAYTLTTTTPPTTTTASLQQQLFMLRLAMDRMRMAHRRRMWYHRRRMRYHRRRMGYGRRRMGYGRRRMGYGRRRMEYGRRRMSQTTRRRRKRDDTQVIIRTIKGIIPHQFNVTNDSNTTETKGGFLSAPGDQVPPFVGDTLIRTKRQVKFAKVVPYLVYAAGEYFSLFDPDGVRLALQRSGKLPMAKKSKATIPVEPRGGPWRMSKNMIPVESSTVKGPQLSPADTSAMARESAHRVKSFIIFFVVITGVVTVITVLLIVTMHGKGEAQTGSDSQQRNFSNNRQCWDRSVQQQDDHLDSMNGRCPVCHDHEQEESQSETTDQDDETDDNDNCQTNNTKSSGAALECNERDETVLEDQFSVKGLAPLQQYQPRLHGDLLPSRPPAAGSRPGRGHQISQVRASSSHDLLKLESTTAITGDTDNTLNNVSTSNNTNTSNNNNYIDCMAIKLEDRQDDDCQTTRVVYSRNGRETLCGLFLNSRPFPSRPGYSLHDQVYLNSRSFVSRPGYSLHDQVYLNVARCQLLDSLQYHKLTRHQDISAVALECHKRQNVTTSHSINNKLESRDVHISPNLSASESTAFNNHGNSCVQSTSMTLTLTLCDSDDIKRATEHIPKVCQSSALTNSMRIRSNSCRINKPALKDKNSPLRPTRRRPVSYRRQRQDRSLKPIKAKLTLPGKPNSGKSSSHDRLLLTLRSAINSSSITGDTEQQEARKTLTPSTHTRKTLTSSTHTARKTLTPSTHTPRKTLTPSTHTAKKVLTSSAHIARKILTSSTHTARTLPAPNMPRGSAAQKSKNESENRGSHHTGNTSDRADSDSTQLTRPIQHRGTDVPQETEDVKTVKEKKKKTFKDGEEHDMNDSKGEQPGGKPVTSVTPSADSASQRSDTGKKTAAKKQGQKDRKQKETQKGKPSGKKSPTSAESSPSLASQKSDVAIKEKDKKEVKKGGKPTSAGKKRPSGRGKRPSWKAGKKSKRTRKKRGSSRKSRSEGMTTGTPQVKIVRDNSQLSYFGPISIGGLATDDALVVRRLQERKELPFNRYTSLSVILKAADIDEEAPVQDRLMAVRKTDINPMQMTTLQPLHHSIPYYISAAKRKKRLAVHEDSANLADQIPARLAPETLGDALQEHCLSGGSSHLSSAPEFHFPGQKWSARHVGIEWPVKYANMPPFSSPGYNCKGVKQPVGVAPIVPVPWKPDYGIVGKQKMKVPTWVSPLYRPYGIGGHLGLEDPFAEAVETELANMAVPQKPVEEKKKLSSKKPNDGFFQWLKNMLKINKSKEERKSRVGSRFSSIFNRKSLPQEVDETSDSQPTVPVIPDVAETPSKSAEPVATSEPRQPKVSFAPPGPQNQISTQPAGVVNEPNRARNAGRPNDPGETGRSHTSEPPDEAVSPSIFDLDDTVNSSISEQTPVTDESSTTSALPPDTPKSSSGSKPSRDIPKSSTKSELPPDTPRSPSVPKQTPGTPGSSSASEIPADKPSGSGASQKGGEP
ncbi:hypothetical protein BsWGS_04072 [Bradybaena similaris]